MFLAPSSSKIVDPYLQTLLLRVSLSRLGGKHRQLARQVGDSVSSSANLMAGSSDANNVPKGTTLVFGSWACTADGLGGFSSHLLTPNSPKSKITPQPADICETSDLPYQHKEHTHAIHSPSIGVYRQVCSGIPLVVRFVGRDRLFWNSMVQGTQRFRQVRAASCVIPYVLCGCLYCLRC